MPQSPADALPLRDPARPVAFMHIPKTSGMALIEGLAAALRPVRAVHGFDLCLFGAFDGFETIHPDVRARIHRSPAEVPAGGDFVVGHMSFATLAASYPEAQLITFLREPRARLLSHWVYWRAQDPAHLSAWGDWAQRSLAGRDGLADFLDRRDVAAQTDNLALRMLLWPHPRVPPDDFIAEADDDLLLTEALARLRRFAHADVVENPRLTESLAAWCGTPIAYPPVNETLPVPPELRLSLHRELTPAAHARLCARSRLDLWLWTLLAERAVGAAAGALGELAFARGVARSAELLAG